MKILYTPATQFLRSNHRLLLLLVLLFTVVSAIRAEAPQSRTVNSVVKTVESEAEHFSPPELVSFVQITDMHLFDEGKKRGSKEEYLRDQQDNRDALNWAIDQINSLIEHGRNLDFVVFTGDFGLELVRESESETPCSHVDDKTFAKYRAQGWPRLVLMRDAANEVAHEFSRLEVSTIYVLPGNNDLVGENPCDQNRYTKFVQAVIAAMPNGRGQVVDLTNPASGKVDWNGLRVFGLNSATFKLGRDDQKQDRNDAASQINELDGRIAASPQGLAYLIFHSHTRLRRSLYSPAILGCIDKPSAMDKNSDKTRCRWNFCCPFPQR